MKKLLEFIRSHQRFLVTTHAFPDGDGFGSQMALHYCLQQLGKTSYAVTATPVPEKFAIVDPQNAATVYKKKLPDIDCALVADTHDWKLLGELGEALKAQGIPVAFIDHHVVDGLPEGPHFIDERSASCGEMVYEIATSLGAKVDRMLATGIYVAMVTDTNGFRYRRTSPRSHRIAAELLEAGISPEDIYQSVYGRDSAAKVRLFGSVLQNVQTELDGQLVWSASTHEELVASHATVEDTESFITPFTLMRGVRIAALFREDEDGRIKVSLRGRLGVSVVELARALGGGGHRFAAGAKVPGDLETVRERVLAGARATLKK